uniref:DUF6505 family protein n=1 Tax=Pararhizobium sp. IMCC3301 TaxID=3067904 RepID=UPI002741AB38|nr:DUF6505 family protein [Pararhizobium sp. IMCC3301]
MKLARTIRFDDSDLNVFETTAQLDEWAVSGAFEFSNWTEANLAGKARQAFSNGWLGLETFGRSTFAAVTAISEREYDDLIDQLSAHFVQRYGAPSLDMARGPATEEIAHMRQMCEDHEDNTLLIVERELVDTGVKERFRVLKPQDADLAQFAVHGDIE